MKLTQQAIYVDISKARFGRGVSKGGAGTSIDNNNVFTVQPTVYFEGMDPTKESASMYDQAVGEQKQNPAVVVTGILAVGALAVAGTAVAVYFFFTS